MIVDRYGWTLEYVYEQNFIWFLNTHSFWKERNKFNEDKHNAENNITKI